MFLQTLNLGVTAVLISHVGGSWESTQNMTAWAGWLVLTSVSEALLLCCFGLPQNWGINFKMFWKTKPKTQVIHIWAEVNDFPLWWKDKVTIWFYQDLTNPTLYLTKVNNSGQSCVIYILNTSWSNICSLFFLLKNHHAYLIKGVYLIVSLLEFWGFSPRL